MAIIKIKNRKQKRVGEDMEKLEPSIHCWWESQNFLWKVATVENSSSSSKKSDIELSYDPVIHY